LLSAGCLDRDSHEVDELEGANQMLEDKLIGDIVSLLKLVDAVRTKYLVEDLLGSDVVVLLLLESPHSHEISSPEIHCRYPAAGDTGLAISMNLLEGIDEPIGKYINEDLNKQKFGIMNCCQLPMQKSAYTSPALSQDLLDAFKTIRNTKINVVKRQKSDTQLVDDKIYENFKKRLSNFLEDNNNIKLVVPCGKMAEYFLNKYEALDKIEIFPLPHPARNNWSRAKNSIKELKKKIQSI